MGVLVSTMVLALAVVGLPRDLARMGCPPVPDDLWYLLTHAPAATSSWRSSATS